MDRHAERVIVIGAGCVGLAAGVGMAGAGHVVLVLEKCPDRLAALRARRIGHRPFG